MLTTVGLHKYSKQKHDTFRNTQPMQIVEKCSHVIILYATRKPIARRHSTPTALCPTDEQEAQLVLHYHNRDVTTPATRQVAAGPSDWPTDWCYDLSQNRKIAGHSPCDVRPHRWVRIKVDTKYQDHGLNGLAERGPNPPSTIRLESIVHACCRRNDANHYTSVFAVRWAAACSSTAFTNHWRTLTRDFVAVHCHQDDRNYRFVCHRRLRDVDVIRQQRDVAA